MAVRGSVWLVLALFAIGSAAAAGSSKADEPRASPAKIVPHFATLRAEKVALRSGPSTDYPIEWLYVRKGLPVEILAGFDIWRKVRDSEGTEGWIQQGLLSGSRNVLITNTVRNLMSDPTADSSVVAQLQPGVIAALTRCPSDWCEVKAGGYRGWVRRDWIWGLEAEEVIP
jgi:SH3-like domain-containing protein